MTQKIQENIVQFKRWFCLITNWKINLFFIIIVICRTKEKKKVKKHKLDKWRKMETVKMKRNLFFFIHQKRRVGMERLPLFWSRRKLPAAFPGDRAQPCSHRPLRPSTSSRRRPRRWTPCRVRWGVLLPRRFCSPAPFGRTWARRPGQSRRTWGTWRPPEGTPRSCWRRRSGPRRCSSDVPCTSAGTFEAGVAPWCHRRQARTLPAGWGARPWGSRKSPASRYLRVKLTTGPFSRTEYRGQCAQHRKRLK